MRSRSMGVFLATMAVLVSCQAVAQVSRGGPATQAEIQVGLCAPFEEIERVLHLRPQGGPVTIWLFDDPALTLFERGLRLRLRIAGNRAELTLKAANQDCSRIDPKAVPPGEGKCEIDMHGAMMAGAVSLSRRLTLTEKDDLVSGRRTAGEMLGRVQIAFLRDVVGFWPLPPNIRALGPIEARSYRTQGVQYDVDVARLPAGDTYVEIARKVPAAEAFRARSAMDSMLAGAGVAACADQSAQAVNKLRSLVR